MPEAWTGELVVRDAQPRDEPAIRSVLTGAFGQAWVADLAESLRSRDDGLASVAVDGSQVIGYVGLSRSWIDAPDRLVDVLVLSPLGVVPARQRQGVGQALMARAIEQATAAGAPLILLEGVATYYPQFGFLRASSLGFTPPSVRVPDAAFLALPLPSYDPSVSGALIYNETFWAYDSVGLR